MNKGINTNEYIINNSIFRIGQVIEVVGRAVKVLVDAGKNTSSILYKGDIIQNISVGGYIKIKKDFEQIIGKIEGESITENKEFSNKNYSSSKNKINRILTIKVLGYLDNGTFERGIKELPLIENTCFLITKEEFNNIHHFVEQDDKPIQIGKLEFDDGVDISLGINKLFASHIGIFGNTGSGKSYTLAKIYRQLFKDYGQNENFQNNAKFIIIDFNGEYIKKAIIPENKKVYNLNTRKEDGDKIPLEESALIDIELISILANATEKTQKPFIERTIRRYKKIHQEESDALDYFKNSLKLNLKNIFSMATKERAYILIEYIKNILDISIDEANDYDWHNTLSYFFKRDIGLGNGQITEEQIQTLNLYSQIDSYEFPDNSISKLIHFLYLQIIYDIYNDKAQNDHIAPAINKLKSKQKDIEKVLDTKNTFDFFKENNLTVINLKDTNIEIKKTIPLLLCKKLYEEHKSNENFKNKSLHIIIDEAHNILSDKSERESESWKDYRLETFEEVIKEGRKFNTFLTIASQRPADISETIISQLHNYFLHRLINNNDLKAVERTISYLDKVSADSIPNLGTGTCILAGLMAKIPVVIKIDEIQKKENQPQSHDIKLTPIWQQNTTNDR